MRHIDRKLTNCSDPSSHDEYVNNVISPIFQFKSTRLDLHVVHGWVNLECFFFYFLTGVRNVTRDRNTNPRKHMENLPSMFKSNILISILQT